jgi:hypothetical protein
MPLYVTEDRGVGDHHTRQCRDFSILDEWTWENHACYTFEPLEPPFFVDQRYANCPKDSPYYKAMRAALPAVLDEDWEPSHTIGNAPTFPED